MPQLWNWAWIKFNLSWYYLHPHWKSNSGLWKVILETFRRWPGKLTKGDLFHHDTAPAHKSVVAMAAMCDCGFELVYQLSPSIFSWLGTIYFLFPNMEKHLAGKQYRTDDKVISAVEDFLRIRMRASIPRESKHCNTDGRNVWTAGETMLKNKWPHLVKFDHCNIVSLWTFQPTLIEDILESSMGIHCTQ